MPGLNELEYEKMTEAHLQQVAALHEVCFPGYYLTRWGQPFLGVMYSWYLESPEAIAHVALHPGDQVAGFVVGTTEVSSYYRSLFGRRAGALLGALARRLLRHPISTLGLVWERKDLVPQAVSSMLVGSAPAGDEPSPHYVSETGTASLVSIGVDPACRRLGIARGLTEAFLTEVRERGLKRVTLSVREDNLPARRFYESLEWFEVGRSSRAYHGSISITYQKVVSENE